MKKVWKGAAAAIAALSLGATGFMGVTSAYAAPTEGKASITLNNFDSAHSYKIYQLMTGTVTAKDGKETITDAKWGSDAKSSGDVSSTTLDDIAGLESTSAEKANTVIEDYVDTAKGSMFTNDGEYDPGYYVIIDQTETPGKGDSVALPVLVLLHAGETFSINEKHDTVVAIKKVEENTKTIDAPGENDNVDARVKDKIDNNYNDTADYNIGDRVDYEFISTVPSNYDEYDVYTYIFTDTLSAGLTFNNDVAVYVDGASTALADTNYTVAQQTSNNGFTVTFGKDKGLKNVNGVNAGSTIKIKFSATLNSNAVVTDKAGNDGNTNTMHLEYSSDPRDTTATKTTEDDSVIVFTYKLNFDKVDATNEATKLAGAKFVIKSTSGDHNGKYATADANGKLSGWLNTKPAATATGMDNGIFESAENTGTFGIQGLDDGTYELEEIVAPDGYSLPANPKTSFTINGKLGDDGKGLQDWSTANGVTEVKVGDKAAESLVSHITNSKASSLPETGGMGTVVLYTAGVAIVLIAGIGLTIALRRRQA